MAADRSQVITLRNATLADIPEILRHRRGMYEDMGFTDANALDAMIPLSAAFLSKAMAEAAFRAWLACDRERVAGGGAVLISPWPAHPYDLECRRATIINVYVYPEYRRRGIARQLMQEILAWCKAAGLARVCLHASDQGRHLYETLGFEPSNEMKLSLR
jgi:GNAT superfamily N-acetyltransferase